MADGAWDIVVGVQNAKEIDDLNRLIAIGTKEINGYTAALRGNAISQQQFEASVRPVAREIQQSTARIKELEEANVRLGASGAKAGYGLLQLGYAADDIQYGFRSIVNNIPQIVMGMGMSAGLAGAASVAAVAVNQLVNKWQDLLRVFNETPYSIQGAKSAMETITEGIGDFGLIGPGGGGFMRQVNQIGAARSAVDEKKARDAARSKGLRDKFDDITTKDQTKQGGLFREALAEYGPQRLQGQIEDRLKKGKKDLSPEQEKNIADFATNLISDALKGKMPAHAYDQNFGPAFTDKYSELKDKENEKASKKELARMDREAEKVVREEEAKRSRQDASLKRRTDEGVRELDEEERAKDRDRQARKEMEIEALQDKKKILDEQAHDKSNRSQVFGGTKAFADHMMTSGLESLSKQKLAEAKELNKKIDALRADLKNDRRQARLG